MSDPHFLDTKGLICPEPVMLLHRAIRRIAVGETLRVESTDPSSTRDIPKFCLHLGHELLSQVDVSADPAQSKTIYRFEIKKG
jgi:tRNA 2-thiouridine synthesizing protein A